MSVERNKVISTLDLGDGILARRYSSAPLGYYKEFTFPLFVDLIDLAGPKLRILDVGAGCGHFESYYFSNRPNSNVNFVLIDSSYTLLELAEKKLGGMGIVIEAYQRSFNSLDWVKGLGSFDIIISHNSLFHLTPEKVSAFYNNSFDLLKDNGAILNQQSFKPTLLKTRFKLFYSVFGPQYYHSADEHAGIVKYEHESELIEAGHKMLFDSEIKKLQFQGWKRDCSTPFASLQYSIDDHLEFMQSAGFTADCIWKMMHFGLLSGLKGDIFN